MSSPGIIHSNDNSLSPSSLWDIANDGNSSDVYQSNTTETFPVFDANSYDQVTSNSYDQGLSVTYPTEDIFGVITPSDNLPPIIISDDILKEKGIQLPSYPTTPEGSTSNAKPTINPKILSPGVKIALPPKEHTATLTHQPPKKILNIFQNIITTYNYYVCFNNPFRSLSFPEQISQEVLWIYSTLNDQFDMAIKSVSFSAIMNLNIIPLQEEHYRPLFLCGSELYQGILAESFELTSTAIKTTLLWKHSKKHSQVLCKIAQMSQIIKNTISQFSNCTRFLKEKYPDIHIKANQGTENLQKLSDSMMAYIQKHTPKVNTKKRSYEKADLTSTDNETKKVKNTETTKR